LLFGLLACILAARNYLLPAKEFMTHYNNYLIFKQSFFHLLEGKNLYAPYPEEHYDFFKYAPAFSLFFGLFAWLPDWLGLALWNLTNVGVLVLAIKKLPNLSNNHKLIFGILVLQEAITTTMNSQSNALIAGLLILSWIALEKGKFTKAGLFIALTAFIKIFGILFLFLFLFYPKWYKSVLPVAGIFVLLFLLPITILGYQGLLDSYQSFGNLLAADHGNFVKYSVMGWLQNWFGIVPAKNTVVLLGFVLQFIPAPIWILKTRNADSRFRFMALLAASLLIWMVIFNHMAESATYIIAVMGVMMWFFYSGWDKKWRIILLIPVMAFTCFGPSDIYPPELRENIVVHWQLKVFPCILIWFICLVQMGQIALAKRITE